MLAHRVVWSVVVVAALLVFQRGWGAVGGRSLKAPRLVLTLTASASIIAINWGIFIWAVTVDRIIETSLGYYINPLVNFVLGAAFLGERLTRIQSLAVALATSAS